MKRYLVCFLLICFYQAKSQTLDLRILESINGPKSAADQTWLNLSNSIYAVSAAAPASMLVVWIVYPR